jgi:hypothetical protein
LVPTRKSRQAKYSDGKSLVETAIQREQVMRSNSLSRLVFATILLAASGAVAFAQTTYTPVQTTYTVVAETQATPVASIAPFEAPKPLATISPVAPELTTFAPSNEYLAPNSYQSKFRVDAFTVIMQAEAIQSRTGRPAITPDENRFLQDLYSGHADRWSMAEASLVVSGVSDRTERQRFLAQLDEIAAQAQAATANAKTLKVKARILGKFLLKGPMHAGYVKDQYTLRQVLDTGHFNCVSSAIMFTIMAHRIGLEVGTITMPHHVFSRIPGFDVEPTSGGVFPADIRVDRIYKHFKAHNEEVGTSYAADRPYHETGDFGVLAEMYCDFAGTQRDAQQYGPEAINYLKAACLDPVEPAGGNNVRSAMNKWFKLCISKHQIAEAATIANLYRQILRNPSEADGMFKTLATAQRQLAVR